MGIGNVISFGGLFVLIGIAWLFSTDRRRVNPRVIFWGVALQLFFGLLVFVFPASSRFFLVLNDFMIKFMDTASAGSRFVFGPLALSPGTTGPNGEHSLGFILIFQAFPLLLFFGSLMALLYYYNIMPRVIKAFAALFSRLMGISGAESLSAASNIFVGIESALAIKPYLGRMTRSELCTILSAGMANISSTMLAVYVITLKDQFPQIAGHLISASLMSAPAAVVMSKILLPETGKPETLGLSATLHYEREKTPFEAVISGANEGLKVMVGIVALLVAVLGLVAVADMALVTFGGNINSLSGIHMDWTLKGLLGYVFYPFTLIIGVPVQDAGIISQIIGERAIVTELISYQDLKQAIAKGMVTDPRSVVIATYALCGFAHVASMAIFIGGYAALAPDKTAELSSCGFRALFAATLACLMTGCVAGACYYQGAVHILTP